MGKSTDFLIEIGTEELPPKALRGLSVAFLEGVRNGLRDQSLAFADAQAFATPRRLAVKVLRLDPRQADRTIDRRGPPLSAALDDSGQPTKAALKFAEGCGVPFDSLDCIDTGKGEYLVFRGVEQGRPATEVLPAIIEDALAGLPVPKRMRWGSKNFEFVRPVHWVVALLGDDILPLELFGIRAGRDTRGHRFHAPGLIGILDASAYPGILEEHGKVIADFEARRQRVFLLTRDAAADVGGQPVYDESLLDEVTALVEWPVAVNGRFEERFLDLPREVLVSTLQEHQRYFPVETNEGGSLLPRFIAISNLDSLDPDKVREGNERVVRPRLSDAGFFWDTDRSRSLASRAPALDQVVFQKKLGTLADRSSRVEQLAAQIAERLGLDSRLVARAAALAKCDLLTGMVAEFPDLQGVMGRYYAQHDNEPDEVAAAIEEQYLPRYAGDSIPGTDTGRILSLADKLDLVTGIFAIGEKPSGTKDPYGLRRAALGSVRILIEGEMDLSLPDLLAAAASQQPVAANVESVAAEVLAFIMERLRTFYTEGAGQLRASPEVFEAVHANQPSSLLDFHRRMQAVLEFAALPAAASLSAANKRVANILRQASVNEVRAVRPDRLVEPEEKSLFDGLCSLRDEVEPLFERRDYGGALVRLASLRDTVDAFFDKVLVMAEDPDLRTNRLALLSQMRGLFLRVADLSRLGG